MTKPLLAVEDLRVSFRTDEGLVRAVRGVSFDVQPGETVGLVGESGSGKSVTNLAIMGLVPNPPGQIDGGTAIYQDRDLLAMSDSQLQSIRGSKIAMIFQDPMTSLNPLMTIEQQLCEVTRHHLGLTKKQARITSRRDVGNRRHQLADKTAPRLPAPIQRWDAATSDDRDGAFLRTRFTDRR